MRNIKLRLAYEGTGFHGWQRQREQTTIQGVLETTITRLTGEPVHVIGAGRTDAGVHALGQVANFPTRSRIPVDGILHGLNSLLPSGISILEATEAPLDFHARYQSLGKAYCYQLLVSRVRTPLWRDRAWILSRPLDLFAMREAVSCLTGRHDFRAFQARGGSVRTTVRTVFSCGVETLPSNRLCIPGVDRYLFSIAAEGFLRYMVRNIVGTLVRIGLGRRPPCDMAEVLMAGSRHEAGPTAPAHGLYLERVFYDPPMRY